MTAVVTDEHEAAAADVAGLRVDDGEGEADGHGCVDGVAALLEDLDAGVGGVVVDGDDHGVAGASGGEAGLLGRSDDGCGKEGGSCGGLTEAKVQGLSPWKDGLDEDTGVCGGDLSRDVVRVSGGGSRRPSLCGSLGFRDRLPAMNEVGESPLRRLRAMTVAGAVLMAIAGLVLSSPGASPTCPGGHRHELRHLRTRDGIFRCCGGCTCRLDRDVESPGPAEVGSGAGALDGNGDRVATTLGGLASVGGASLDGVAGVCRRPRIEEVGTWGIPMSIVMFTFAD